MQIFPPHLIVPGNLKNVQFRRPLPGLIKCLVSSQVVHKLSLEFRLCKAVGGGIDISENPCVLLETIFARLRAFVQHLFAEKTFKTADNQYRPGAYYL